MSTEPGSAAACTRAAMFGASPNTSPVASTTTGPDLKTDARRQLRRALGGVPGVEVGERALDRERRPHGALGVILLRVRIAEQAISPSPSFFSTWPPSPVTAAEASSR